MSEGGYGCSVLGGNEPSEVFTWLDANLTIISNGNINRWCIKSNGIGNVKLKIFRGDIVTGATKIYDSGSQAVVSGINTFVISPAQAVLAGDYIALFANSADIILSTSVAVGTINYDTGDVDTFISEGGSGNQALITRVWDSTGDNIYVNSSTGSDSNVGDSCVAGHPVLTFAKAYSLLTSGGTIHVCNSGADFSTETVTLNKSFSIDLNGADGYFYMPQAS